MGDGHLQHTAFCNLPSPPECGQKRGRAADNLVAAYCLLPSPPGGDRKGRLTAVFLLTAFCFLPSSGGRPAGQARLFSNRNHRAKSARWRAGHGHSTRLTANLSAHPHELDTPYPPLIIYRSTHYPSGYSPTQPGMLRSRFNPHCGIILHPSPNWLSLGRLHNLGYCAISRDFRAFPRTSTSYVFLSFHGKDITSVWLAFVLSAQRQKTGRDSATFGRCSTARHRRNPRRKLTKGSRRKTQCLLVGSLRALW